MFLWGVTTYDLSFGNNLQEFIFVSMCVSFILDTKEMLQLRGVWFVSRHRCRFALVGLHNPSPLPANWFEMALNPPHKRAMKWKWAWRGWNWAQLISDSASTTCLSVILSSHLHHMTFSAYLLHISLSIPAVCMYISPFLPNPCNIV